MDEARHARPSSAAHNLRRSVGVALATGALLTGTVTAFADTTQGVDADTASNGTNVSYTVTDTPASRVCAGRDTTSAPGVVSVKFNGNVNDHFTATHLLDITFSPVDGDDNPVAGIHVTTAANQHVPDPWNKDASAFTINYSTKVDTSVYDGSYTVYIEIKDHDTGVTAGDGGGGRPSFQLSLSCDNPAPSVTPTVEAGGPYTGNEGSAVTLAGSTSDFDASTIAYKWTATAATSGDVPDAGASCSFAPNDTTLAATVTCTDNGDWTLQLGATDATHTTAITDTASLSLGNVAPDNVTATPSQASACSVGLSVSWTDAGSNDTHDVTVDWGDSSTDYDPAGSETSAWTVPAHTYAGVGPFTATVTVTDDDGDSGSPATQPTLRTYNRPGSFLQPLNTTGTRSSFKIGSTIPVKITVTDCANNAVSNLTPAVNLEQNDTTADTSVNEGMVSEVPTNGKLMRWDTDKYIYNLSTKNSQFGGGTLTTGTWTVSVSDPSFFAPAKLAVAFDLKK